MKAFPKLTLALLSLTVAVWGYGFRVRGWQLLPETLWAEAETPKKSAPAPKPPPKKTPSGKPGPGNVVLQKVKESLTGMSGVQAQLQLRVGDDPHGPVARGRYLQGSDFRLRLELQFEQTPIPAQMVQVCDGQVLWTYNRTGDDETFTRRDIRELLVREARKKRAVDLPVELALGGLPALVSSLEKFARFNQVEKATVGGRDLIVLEGKWTPLAARRWMESGKKNASTLPDRIRLFLDGDTLFPRRLQYLRDTNDGEENCLTIDWTEVRINTPIDARHFEFVPPDGVIPTDVTRDYLDTVASGIQRKKRRQRKN